MWKTLILTFTLTVAALETVNRKENNETESQYSFEVDLENNQFLLDGEPFRYVSGSFHYFRAPRQYWRDRLRRLRAAGLNAVCTYVEWSLHQPEPDEWNWSGEADIIEFLNIAQQEDLLVLLRPGPYICAERDMGGFPYWLLREVPDIKLRTNDQRYMEYVEVYLNELLSRVKPYLRGNGGPVIMVQVENEYGSYKACDTKYMEKLRDLFVQNVGTDAVLYTTDGASTNLLKCGTVSGIYPTIDFGTTSNVTKYFDIFRNFQSKGPLVNSEFYPGWLTHWNESFQTVGTEEVTDTLDAMLSMGASINFYMFYGGTNFGFTSGANSEPQYSPQITSYDYDAPLTEAGDPTTKYFKIRDVISKYLPMSNLTLPPDVSPKGNYGSVLMESVIGLFDPLSRALFGTRSIIDTSEPPTLEALGLPHGLVLYETQLSQNSSESSVLQAIVRDRSLVYVDGRLSGTLSRTLESYTMPLEDSHGDSLMLLLEDEGRLNYGSGIEDFKGIANVTVNDIPLSPWNVTGFRLDSVEPLRQIQQCDVTPSNEDGTLFHGPLFLRGNFEITGDLLDTFLDTTGWGKGVAYVNGYNLGRYWPNIGPQITLYVPAPYLQFGKNELVLLELEYVPKTRKIKFQTIPNLNNGT